MDFIDGGVFGEHAGGIIICAVFVEQGVGLIIEAHVDPDAPAFRIPGGQLVSGVVDHHDIQVRTYLVGGHARGLAQHVVGAVGAVGERGGLG